MADEALSGAGRVRQARDVMAFGQDLGRVLSDGRIVAAVPTNDRAVR